MELGRICKQIKREDMGVKTQLRFGEQDIEVYTKRKGAPKPFKRKELMEIVDLTRLPPFDHNKEWRNRKDRPPRRKVLYTEDRGNKYALRNEEKTSEQEGMETESGPSVSDDDDKAESPAGEKSS